MKKVTHNLNMDASLLQQLDDAQMRHNLRPPFPTLTLLWREIGTPPRKGEWRIVDPQMGQFHALPNMRGVSCASDGSRLIVQKLDGTFCTGHVTNWTPDEGFEGEIKCHFTKKRIASNAKASTSSTAMSAHLAALLE